MKTMKKIYLHMGLHKTATSSFQHTCKNNIDNLKSQGYVFPLFDCIQNKQQNHIANHSVPIFSCFTPNPSNYHMNIRWQIENVHLANSSYLEQLEEYLSLDNNMIISGEDISILNVDSLNGFITFLEKHQAEIIPVVFVRSPYAFHCSHYQGIISSGGYADFSVFVSQKNRILNLKKVFKDKIRFVAFDEACKHPAGPVGFLLEYFGVKFDDFSLAYSNKGVSNGYARFQNSLNKYQPSIVKNQPNQEHIKARRIKGNKFYLTKEELSLIKEDLDEENLFFRNNLGEEFCDLNFETSKDFKVDDLVAYYPELFFSKLRNLSPSTIDYLRDLAIHEEGGNLNLAYEIMSLAHEARPSGSFIKKKQAEYKDKLASTALKKAVL